MPKLRKNEYNFCNFWVNIIEDMFSNMSGYNILFMLPDM